jgi:uncharacterized repeat protein (TIGR01451 family)
MHLLRLLVAISLLAMTGAACAITASIEGTYAGGGGYNVKLGQFIEISGDCKTSGVETRDGTWWKVGDNDAVYYPRAGTTTTHAFTVAGAEGSAFDVTLICHTSGLLYKNDTATRTFHIVDSTPPEVSWDNRTPYANSSITVEPLVTDSASSIGDVRLRWTVDGGMSREVNMDQAGGTPEASTYSYKIDTSRMTEGRKDVEIQAGDTQGNSTGWIPLGHFIVDRSPPSLSGLSVSIAGNLANVTLPVTDNVSGVDRVWIRWETGSGWSPVDIKMHGDGAGRYTHAIDTQGIASGTRAIEIWALDKAGNNTGWVRKGSFIVDNTAPTINWLAPLDHAMLSGDSIRIAGNLVEQYPDYVTIEWQAEGATAWQRHVEKMKAGSNDFEYALSGLKQGVNYRLRLQAADKAGNVSAVTPARTVIGQLAVDALFKNSQFSIVDQSLVDKDDSGGFSRGDDLIYAIELQTGNIAANGISLRYALPDGLAMTPQTRPYLAPESASKDGSQLNAHWNGADNTQLLADGVDLAADSKLLIHIPVTITAFPAASPVASTVLAGAVNARDDLRLEHNLSLQATFPANHALDLELTSLQPDWKYRQGTAFDYRIALRVRAWDLSNVELRYALPAGLQKSGEARIEGDGAAALHLNPAWGEGGEQLLLSSAPGLMLASRHAFNVIIPVKVGAKAAPGSALRSEIEASAGNLSGPVTAMHSIVPGDAAEPEEQLVLKKTIDKQAADKRTALPGQTLRYTITYSNVGIDDLHDLVIDDTFQSDYLTLGDAQCGPIMPRTLHCRLIAGSAPGKLE